jgi:hypothetical protein
LTNNHEKNETNEKLDKKEECREVIFRPCITTKSGNKIYAKSYGLKAFKIYI